MKKYSVIILMLIGCSVYGQKARIIKSKGKSYVIYKGDTMLVYNDFYVDTVYVKDSVVRRTDKKTGRVFYGLAGIKKDPDSSKIFWKLYVKNKQRGIPDSLNKYYIKLKK